MTSRVLEPELLDELPAEDHQARRSRNDLRRLNGLMGHASLIARELRHVPSGKHICDLGSGDGDLMLSIVKRLGWNPVELMLVDQQPVVLSETLAQFAALRCRTRVMAEDVFDALSSLGACDVITANLFLHHFTNAALRDLLQLVVARTRLFVACEPRRSSCALLASRCVGLIGCNAVTRHDAVASVRAGFRDQELSKLWGKHDRWIISERPAGLFSHLFVAKKL